MLVYQRVNGSLIVGANSDSSNGNYPMCFPHGIFDHQKKSYGFNKQVVDEHGFVMVCAKLDGGVHQTIMGIPPSEPMLHTDNVVCPDCNMEDARFYHILIG